MKPSAIRQALPGLLAKRRPVFMWGPPGVGKSDVVRRVADDMKLELRDVRLSLLDPVDLKGFPIPNMTKKQIQWLPADFLPTDKKSKGILFLDEMNHAPMSVQSAAYQLILNFKIGDYELPPGWSIIAAGNRTGDRSGAIAQPAALANRFVHLDYDVNVDDWNNWAMEAGLHTDLRAFIRFKPSLLYKYDAATNPRAFPTPRSWAFVNDIYKDRHSTDVEFELIRGTIGEGAAGEFLAFTQQIKDLPTVDQILIDPDGAKVPDNPGAQFAITTALDSKATKANINVVMKYMSRLSVEFQTIFFRAALRRDNSLTQTKTYMDWGLKHQSVLT